MLKNLLAVNTSWWEFLLKFPVVLFLIMPGCMGGAVWLGIQLDTALHIHLLKFVLPFIGTIVGVFLTALLLAAGHFKQLKQLKEAH
jgi:hypothetical protein